MDLVEFLKTENLAFKRKLQSKSEALHILQSQLQSCEKELEQHRRPRRGSQLGSQLRSSENFGQVRDGNSGHTKDALSRNAEMECARLTHLEVANKKQADENKLLQFDLEDLKQKLNDANNDILMLRKQQTHFRQVNPLLEKTSTTSCTQHLEQLEHLNRKYSRLELDLQIVLDEKQDLIKQRDIYYDKMQRLNIQIRNLLNIPNQNIDFDAIVMENKYLKQRLEDVLNEKKLWSKTVSKYKNMLNNNYQNTGKVLSYDQIAKHINSMTSSRSTHSDQNNLHQICITLLDTLNEKNLLLQHQRKTNKVLAGRVLELESQNGRSQTCDVLLKGYSATEPCEILDIDGKVGRSDSASSEESCENGQKVGIEIGNSRKMRGKYELSGKNGIRVESQNQKNRVSEERNESILNEGTTVNDETQPEEVRCSDNNKHGEGEAREQTINEQQTETNQDRNSNCDLMLKSVQEMSREFEEHEDIQNLPYELQKLVLEALKDLEENNLKCL